MRKTVAVIGLIAAALTVPAAPALAAPDTHCTGALGAVTVDGKLVVPNGATCTLTGTTLLAVVEVGVGSTLNATGVSIAGGISAGQHQAVTIGGNSSIQGHVKAFRGGSVTVTDSSVFGGLELFGNTAAVTVANVTSDNADITLRDNQGGVSVQNSHANGNLKVAKNSGGATVVATTVGDGAMIEENSGGTTVNSNRVLDNISISKNRGGATQISNNSTDDNLDCIDNDPAPTGSGNVAGADGNGAKSGQCAGL
ncbi:hypothetical protein SAMN05421505_15112 [Sinosporangium album]|uniref:Right handed beta helix region n=1 Tax=Sinosporangium album TaxID=504805 RepID=A0A1G8KJQ5_9ACTN|nr:hypothetical protein [Sinosporangium album]SDI43130.1 hypothetical protein SAMN05421505_15112 [Sinosporangium album]